MKYNAKYDKSSNRYQSVKDHSLRVAELASQSAEEFHCGDIGYLEGILHDAGKCSDLFQKVLNGTATEVNHSFAGACFAKSKYKSDLAAKAIFAHHTPLREDIDIALEASVKECEYDYANKTVSVTGEEEYRKLWEELKSELPLPLIKPKRPGYDFSSNRSLAKMLMTRMLLSCLCDADYLSSAEFEEDTVYAPPAPPDFARYYANLQEYREEIIRNSASESGINAIRNRIYHACLQAANCAPGLFTLTAPTGTGKTLALLAFALHHAIQFAKKRVIIVLPFLSIIDQNAAIYRRICGDVLEDHSAYDRSEDQYAAYHAERWSADIIVTTSVKLFEMLFKSKASELRRLHMLCNSVVVFDEAQTLPNDLLAHTLESVNALCARFGTTVLFSTATQPSFEYRDDIRWHPTEIVTEAAEIFQKTKRVDITFAIKDVTPLSEIAERMSVCSSCCAVLNRKDHVRKLYAALVECCEPESCYMITTDLCSLHRKQILGEIDRKLKSGMPCRIVATQCIEAGVDIDVAVMYRALAPLDSIIQCAGRCNRNNRGEGKMTVFIPDEEKLYPSSFYEYGAQTVKLLLSRHPIDINDLAHIAEYYELLYTCDKTRAHDNPKLVEAVKALDYEKTDKQYHLIHSGGCNVIVPYSETIELFDEIKTCALNEGISPSLIRKARAITITSYDDEAVKNVAESLCYRRHGQANDTYPSNWYILCDKDFYNEKTGFCANADSELHYTF